MTHKDNPPSYLAAHHANLYMDFIRRAADRILSSSDPIEQQADALLLTVAVRNVLRAGKLLQEHSQDSPELQLIATAVRQFEKEEALRDITSARDVIEHFDDYAAGKGRLGRDVQVDFKRTSDNYVVTVSGEKVMAQLGVREAQGACRNLASVLTGVATKIEIRGLKPPEPC